MRTARLGHASARAARITFGANTDAALSAIKWRRERRVLLPVNSDKISCYCEPIPRLENASL
jgi:hypothetical protein